MKIQVLGSGCSRCINLAANVEIALQELGLEVVIDKVKAIEEITAYHVFATPALVIDGSIKSASRIPSPTEIGEWIVAANKDIEARPAHS